MRSISLLILILGACQADKVLRLGGRNLVDLSFDLYNALNVDAIQNQNNTYSGVNGGAWLRPTTVINPRFMRLTARWDF